MSVGGKVIEVVDCGDRIWINTLDQSKERCAIYVTSDDNARRVRFRDSVWWQGPHAYWTPRDGSAPRDTRLQRIGNSHVSRPSA